MFECYRGIMETRSFLTRMHSCIDTSFECVLHMTEMERDMRTRPARLLIMQSQHQVDEDSRIK